MERSVWADYRNLKLRLLVLLVGWVPFGVLCGAAIPVIFGTYVPSYALALAYMLFAAYTWLMYVAYPCPKCGKSLRGRQLFWKTCKHCGLEINN
jgi:hypothetical protein